MTAISLLERSAVTAAAPPRQVLSSRLGGEEYGIDILAVQEIRRYEPPTRIANAASDLLGIMNLRGVIVPIVDLRERLGLPVVNGTDTVTVVVNLGERTVGLVVDGVSDVVSLTTEQVQPRPRLGSQRDADFIAGVASLNAAGAQRLLLLIDLVTLLRDL